MIKPLSQIQRLRELLEAQEGEAMQSQYPQPSPKVVVEKVKVEERPEPPTLLQKPSKRPKSIEGFTLGDILLLQADGGLDVEAEEWLALKNIPNPDGSMRMPNVKALMRRGQRKSDNA
jgi:hypothetical protein